MPAWSALSTCRKLLQNVINKVPKRSMSGGHDRNMDIQPPRWQHTKFKDFFHFYVMLGAIPCGLLVTYTNIFIGPATLSETPGDYVPKYWEYYRHPITRWIARNVLTDPQQEYEKYLHALFEEEEARRMRRIDQKVKDLIKVRGDYQMYYYKPVASKFVKSTPDYDFDDVKRVQFRDDDWEYHTSASK